MQQDRDQPGSRGSAHRGVTLLEMLVVVAVMALLATVLIPNVGGFLSGGKEKTYAAEKETLQLAVDTWRNSAVARNPGPLFPILLGGNTLSCLGAVNSSGDPVGGCNPYIDIKALADQAFIRSPDAVKSAKLTRNTTATNSTTGSYGWYLRTGGLVSSLPPFTKDLYP